MPCCLKMYFNMTRMTDAFQIVEIIVGVFAKPWLQFYRE